MTNLEIKKLYKKTKAAFERRTGRRLTWYMSGAQMAKGTATICTAAVIDYAEAVAQAERSAARTEAEARELWRFFERKAAEGGKYWRDDMAERMETYGDVDGYVKAKQAAADKHLAEARAKLAEVGSQAAETERQVAAAEKMSKEPEIAAFVKAIGGSTTTEVKRDGWSNLVYLRFHYKAD